MIDLLLTLGAIAYITTLLVLKDGPGDIFKHFKNVVIKVLGEKNTPFNCLTCTAFWSTILVITLDYFDLKSIITLFGLAGLSQAIRGLSSEF